MSHFQPEFRLPSLESTTGKLADVTTIGSCYSKLRIFYVKTFFLMEVLLVRELDCEALSFFDFHWIFCQEMNLRFFWTRGMFCKVLVNCLGDTVDQICEHIV